MKIINKQPYYKMSELVKETGLSNHTIAFYSKKGLLPNTHNTSKNMKYYPKITISILNMIKYFKEHLNFSIDYIKELFDYYNIDFNDRAELILQSIQMISSEIKNPIPKEDLNQIIVNEAIVLDLVDDKDVYFKTEVEVLKVYEELRGYEVAAELIGKYVSTSKQLAMLERKLTTIVVADTGDLPEILVLDILNSFKPYIFNRQTIKEYKKEEQCKL